MNDPQLHCYYRGRLAVITSDDDDEADVIYGANRIETITIKSIVQDGDTYRITGVDVHSGREIIYEGMTKNSKT